jgi:glucosylceramidase
MRSIIPILIIIMLLSANVKSQVKTSGYADTGQGKIKVFTTAKDTDLRLTHTGTMEFSEADQPTEVELSIFVNPNSTFQELLGIGGSITDASAEVFASLPDQKQEEFLDAYFSDDGIGYSLMRTHIHSCDFSSGSYTYIQEGDAELKTFNIAHDLEYRVPMIKKALDKTGGKLKIYVSPWSPPSFMKSNKNMLRGGSLLPEYYDSWARYFTKFIKAYEDEGIPVWGLTIQNEPMATQRWESCIYSAREERDFLKDHLGPVLAKEGLSDKKIIVWDHNRDLIVNRANTILGDPGAAKYVWGIGFHWYETWTGSDPNFKNLALVQESFPDIKLVFTEGCNENFDPEKYEYWPNAERYGNSMINDFNNGTVGWTDWNILLNEHGGPNHVQNFCFAPVHGDVVSGELIYTPSYYYIGHFSKFMKPGAKRVSTSCSRSFLQSTTFMNKDGTFATVVMNQTDQGLEYQFYVNDQKVDLTIPARAIQTILY